MEIPKLPVQTITDVSVPVGDGEIFSDCQRAIVAGYLSRSKRCLHCRLCYINHVNTGSAPCTPHYQLLVIEMK